VAAPPGALDHPKIKVVVRRFSAERLDQTVEIVASRLNPLLAPSRLPGTAGVWPWEAWVETDENMVFVVVGREHKSKRALVEAALADEIEAGVLRISYDKIEANSY
jgi:hypothetical protein